MRTLYFDLAMGAAGDMLSAALYELLNEEERKAFIEELKEAGIPGVTVTAEKSVKCGITGTHFKVTVNGEEEESLDDDGESCENLHHHEHSHDGHSHEHHHDEYHEHSHEHEHGHEHHHDEHHEHEHNHDGHSCHHYHTSMSEIENIIDGLKIPLAVKTDVIEVYKLIAEAESNVHGVPVTDIHFHEVGTMDAVADITATALLFNKIDAQKITSSSINVGSGHVHCAHGILPVPAPATAFILKDVPVYSGHITGELCTPTGAALLKHFVNSFEKMPEMKIKAIGYGMGKKDFEAANCVRAILGESTEKPEQILEYTCNLDDISAEKIGFAMERLFAAGAVEVYTVPVNMKKSRPGNLLCVMCRESDKEKILETIFKYTTTLGVRENISKRYALSRSVETLQTPYGAVRVKNSEGYGVKRSKFEYEDLAKISRETGKPLDELEEEIKGL